MGMTKQRDTIRRALKILRMTYLRIILISTCFEFIPPASKLLSLLTIYLNSKQISELNSSSTFSIILFTSLPSPPLNNELYPPKLGGMTASSNQLIWNMCYLSVEQRTLFFPSFLLFLSNYFLSFLPSFIFSP